MSSSSSSSSVFLILIHIYIYIYKYTRNISLPARWGPLDFIRGVSGLPPLPSPLPLQPRAPDLGVRCLTTIVELSGYCQTSTAGCSAADLSDLRGQCRCQKKDVRINVRLNDGKVKPKRCQVECQKNCPHKCQKVCQNRCQIDCKKECQSTRHK